MDLSKLFSVPRFTSGRRLQAYRRMRVIAVQYGMTALVAHIDRAIAHDEATRGLDDRWSSSMRRKAYDDEVAALDMVVDPTLSSIRDLAEAQLRGVPADAQTPAMVATLLDGIFPHGVARVTRLPYVDQAAAVKNIVGKLQNELAPQVVALGLERKVAALAELSVRYSEAVDRSTAGLDFATVRKARDEGQQYLLEAIALIIGTYYDSRDPAHVAARTELLAPALEQMGQIRARTRSRRSTRRAAADSAANDGGELGQGGEDGQGGDLDDLDDEPMDVDGDLSPDGDQSPAAS